MSKLEKKGCKMVRMGNTLERRGNMKERWASM